MNEEKNFLEIPIERLKVYKKLSPEERLKWLEEAQRFTQEVLSTKKRELWKRIREKWAFEDA